MPGGLVLFHNMDADHFGSGQVFSEPPAEPSMTWKLVPVVAIDHRSRIRMGGEQGKSGQLHRAELGEGEIRSVCVVEQDDLGFSRQ
jgi:hypothetical protein